MVPVNARPKERRTFRRIETPIRFGKQPFRYYKFLRDQCSLRTRCFLPDQNLWLDPWDAKPFAFVSHAHSDHIAAHDEIIVSERTARLMQARLPGKRNEHVVSFGEMTTVRGLDLMLLPAGHIFGSAQFFLQTDADSLLYTGDFKLRHGKSAEPAEWRQADTLIMETTYGLPRYRLPPTEQVIQQIVAFCREALDEGAVPILLGYSLGKAQEILCALAGAGLTPMLHGSVYQMTRIYEQFGQSFCEYERYKANEVAGKVLICPPSANRSRMLEKIPRKRVAMISGWAVEPNAIYRYQVDAAFPLSDHADYNDLLRYVELVQPKRVLTLHGFAAEFARDLRDRGYEAWALSAQNQMELTLGTSAVVAAAVPGGRTSAAETAAATPSEFAAFADVGEAIAATPAKLEKVRLLSEYLRTLPNEQLPIATIYFTGKPFPQSDLRTLQVGWSVIFRALIAASKLSEAEFRRIASSHGDAGKTAFEALDGRTSPEPFGILESRAFFDDLQKMRGPLNKTELLQTRFAKLSAREAEYVVKILTGDLRIGLREGLVEEAIAVAFDAPLDEVKEANMLLGDIGQTALLASQNNLQRAELSLFRPIKSMLASPEPTAEAIWERFNVAAAVAGGRDGDVDSHICRRDGGSYNNGDDSLRRRQIRWHSRATASWNESRGNFFARSAPHDRSIRRDRGTRRENFPTKSFSTAKSWRSSTEKNSHSSICRNVWVERMKARICSRLPRRMSRLFSLRSICCG